MEAVDSVLRHRWSVLQVDYFGTKPLNYKATGGAGSGGESGAGEGGFGVFSGLLSKQFQGSRLSIKVAAGCWQGTWAMAKKKTPFETVEPIGDRVLVRKDEPKRETKGGIALPDAAEIPTITGRIVTISTRIENDEDVPLRQYDKILFHPKNAIPVDFEADNQLFVVPVDDVVAVFRTEKE
jgi:chaperonin GroES